MYHLTRKEYLESIMVHGLIPGFSRGITRNRRAQECVFLTDDVRVPIEQLGHTYRSEEWCTLSIDTRDMGVKPHVTTGLLENVTVPNEFVTNARIPPWRIKKQ